MNDPVQAGIIEDRVAVSPHCNDPARPQHSPRLSVEAIVIEPVYRLRNRHSVHRRILEPAIVRSRDSILDRRMRIRHRYLLLARIGGDDAVENFRESDRGLSAACCAIPHELMAMTKPAYPGEKLIRISRAILGVKNRAGREMVLEFHLPKLRPRSLPRDYRVFLSSMLPLTVSISISRPPRPMVPSARRGPKRPDI